MLEKQFPIHTSEQYTFNGYKFKEWAIRNKESIKMIVLAAVALATFYTAPYNPTLSAALMAIVTGVSKLILDAVDYWQKE